MKNYRYSVISADLIYNVSDHPQKVMKGLGAKLIKSEPCLIADCWFFRIENEIPDPLPGYLNELSADFKFSDE